MLVGERTATFPRVEEEFGATSRPGVTLWELLEPYLDYMRSLDSGELSWCSNIYSLNEGFVDLLTRPVMQEAEE